MKRLIVVIVLMFLGGCGYSSYEECQLKESQKCETSDCSELVKDFCKTEFPRKLTYIESKHEYKINYEEKAIRIYPQRFDNSIRSKKYNVCVTFKSTQKCKKLEPESMMRFKNQHGDVTGGFYGPIFLEQHFPHVSLNFANRGEELSVYLEEGQMLR